MKKTLAVTLALTLALAATAGQAFAGDPATGKKVFNKCKACHSLKAGKKKIGPSLYGIFGRISGTQKGFRYSKAMKKAKVTWSEETLDTFLASPKKMIKGNRMPFSGLRNKTQRADLIAYLKQATK